MTHALANKLFALLINLICVTHKITKNKKNNRKKKTRSKSSRNHLKFNLCWFKVWVFQFDSIQIINQVSCWYLFCCCFISLLFMSHWNVWTVCVSILRSAKCVVRLQHNILLLSLGNVLIKFWFATINLKFKTKRRRKKKYGKKNKPSFISIRNKSCSSIYS